jgi:hypothetical protein
VSIRLCAEDKLATIGFLSWTVLANEGAGYGVVTCLHERREQQHCFGAEQSPRIASVLREVLGPYHLRLLQVQREVLSVRHACQRQEQRSNRGARHASAANAQ